MASEVLITDARREEMQESREMIAGNALAKDPTT